ncbi:MAG: aldo/keto reductase [Chloroflexi bacterium]|nr:aldo/keto reductase [Chloroflexota bacterium]
MRTVLLEPLGRQVGSVGWGLGRLLGRSARHLDDLLPILHTAIDLGINFWEVSPRYGQGLAEQVVGALIKEPDQEVVLLSHLNDTDGGFEGGFDATLYCVDGTLQRLGWDHLPLLHLVVRDDPPLDWLLHHRGALGALSRLRAEGIVEHIGVSGADVLLLRRALATGEFEAVLSFGHIHLLDDSALDPLFAQAKRTHILTINGAPFAGGQLTPPGIDEIIDAPDTPEDVLERVDELLALLDQHGLSIEEAALGFSTSQSLIDVTLVGASTVNELEQCRLILERDPTALLAFVMEWAQRLHSTSESTSD